MAFIDNDEPSKQKVQGLDTDDMGAAAGRADFLLKSVKNPLKRLCFNID